MDVYESDDRKKTKSYPGEGKLADQLAGLENHVGAVSALAETLNQRLTPVMGNYPVRPVEMEESDSSRSDLLNYVTSIRNSLHLLEVRLDNILECLEV